MTQGFVSLLGVIERELYVYYTEILSLLDFLLIPHSDSPEGKVTFYRMKGEYHHYLAEISRDTEKRQEAILIAQEAFNNAQELAKEYLISPSPQRLAAGLKYSVFCYEVLNRKEEACRIAKNAFDEAICGGDVSEEEYEHSTEIIQQLRDKLTLWTQDEEEEEEEEGN